MAAVVHAGVQVARRLQAVSRRGRSISSRGTRGDRRLNSTGAHRARIHVHQAHAAAVAVNHHCGTDDGPVLCPSVELLERPGGIRCLRDPHLGEEIVLAYGRLQETGEEVVHGYLPGARRPLDDHRPAEGDDRGRQVRRRIAVGQRSPEGSTVADLGVADLRGGCGQQAGLAADQVTGLHVAVPGEGADSQHVTVVADVGEVRQATDVNHDRRGRQPVLHEGQQGMTAGQELGLVTVLGEEGDRVLGRSGQLVFEGDRNHRELPAACRTAATMLW